MKGLKPLYEKMHTVSNYVNKLIGFISVVLVVLCTGTVLLQVVNRYVIVRFTDYSASFTDELARFLLIWIAYTAVAMCLREGSMAQVDMVYSKLGKKGRLIMYIFTRLVMGVTLYVIIRYGLWFAAKKASYHTSMLSIPGNILYATVPIGGILMAYEWLTELVGVFAGEIEPYHASAKRSFLEHEEENEDAEKLQAFAAEIEHNLISESKDANEEGENK